MTGLFTWWRKAGGVLCALLLTLMAFGPGLDSLLCHNESEPAVAAPAAFSIAVAVDGHQDRAGAPCGVCAHGHCHHVVAHVPTAATSVAEPLALRTQRAIDGGSVRTSNPEYGLKRPPRA